MFQALFISMATLFIIAQSWVVGKVVSERTKLTLNELTHIPLGFLVIFGFVQFFTYFIVFYKLPMYWILSIAFAFILMMDVLIFKHRLRFNFNRRFMFQFVFILFYIVLMIVVTSKRTLGSNGFDAMHYLNLVTHNSFSATASYTDYSTGLASQLVNPTYDYQSYYLIAAQFVRLYDAINKFYLPNYLMINTGIFVWIFSIMYFLLNSILVLEYLKYVKSMTLKVLLGIILLLFFSNLYFNNAFAFFGNTYRTIIIGFLMYLIFRSLEEGINLRLLVLISIIASSLIAFSSSGVFISTIIFYSYSAILILKREKHRILYSAILMFPLVEYAIFFITDSGLFHFMLLIYLCALCYFTFKQRNFNSLIHDFSGKLDTILWVIIPLVIFGISLYILNANPKDLIPFFTNHSNMDMVWDLFDFSYFDSILFNSLFLISLTVYLFLDHSDFRKMIILILVTFINPISYAFVYKHMASVVYYRSFDAVFNPFMTIMIVSFALNRVKPTTIQKTAILVLIPMFLFISKTQIDSYYHYTFVPEASYNPLTKLDQDEFDVMSVLKTKIALEDYRPARVVSSIEALKAFVPNVVTPIPYQEYRILNRYIPVDEPSKLMNIFIKRDYYNQSIFKQEPDYQNTCKYLMDEKTDFVVVDMRQYFVDESGYVHLYFLVRDCAQEIYKNNTFALFQFYWK